MALWKRSRSAQRKSINILYSFRTLVACDWSPSFLITPYTIWHPSINSSIHPLQWLSGYGVALLSTRSPVRFPGTAAAFRSGQNPPKRSCAVLCVCGKEPLQVRKKLSLSPLPLRRPSLRCFGTLSPATSTSPIKPPPHRLLFVIGSSHSHHLLQNKMSESQWANVTARSTVTGPALLHSTAIATAKRRMINDTVVYSRLSGFLAVSLQTLAFHGRNLECKKKRNKFYFSNTAEKHYVIAFTGVAIPSLDL